MNIFIENEELYESLNQSEIRIIDCRFTLGRPNEGSEQYQMGHIPGAVFIDLEKDLSGEAGQHGGRHPLPSIKLFVEKLEKSGIGNSSSIVVYDGGEGAYAARFYWMMKYLGHQKVFLLQGGYKGWVEAGYPVDRSCPSFSKLVYQPSLQKELLTEYGTVKSFVEQEENLILIDSREQKRYKGIEEKIDKKCGHIPGAINKVWFEGIQNGRFRPAEEQIERFKDIDKSQKIAVYCGSGVTAAPNFIALKMAGYENVSVYIGSFSDYISYEGNPIAAVVEE